jgi:hypothetical protein
MEELLVYAILAERAREAARINLASEFRQFTGPARPVAPAGSTRFAAVGWLRQLASSRR